MLKKFEPAPLPVSLIYVRESRITAKLRAFIDYAAPRIRTRLTDAAICGRGGRGVCDRRRMPSGRSRQQ